MPVIMRRTAFGRRAHPITDAEASAMVARGEATRHAHARDVLEEAEAPPSPPPSVYETRDMARLDPPRFTAPQPRPPVQPKPKQPRRPRAKRIKKGTGEP